MSTGDNVVSGLLEAVGRLIPDLFEALKNGTSEAELRAALAANRAEMDAAFDAAEQRILDLDGSGE